MGNVITKSYESVFILDASKLSRLLNILEERFCALKMAPILSFELTTKKGKSFHATDVKNVLEHDNPINNPIIDLMIEYYDTKDDPHYLCKISYDKQDSKMQIRIQSDNMKWGNDLFAEIEEQIERSFIKSWVYSLKSDEYRGITFSIISVLMGVLASTFLAFSLIHGDTNIKVKTEDRLTASDIEHLKNISKKSNSIEDKIDFLYDLNKRKLENTSLNEDKKENELTSTLRKIKDYSDWRIILLMIPIIIIILCMIYLFKYCYPGSLFLWGDYIEYYQTLLERRKFLWNTVILALLIGIIGNLFVFGFSKVF